MRGAAAGAAADAVQLPNPSWNPGPEEPLLLQCQAAAAAAAAAAARVRFQICIREGIVGFSGFQFGCNILTGLHEAPPLASHKPISKAFPNRFQFEMQNPLFR
jgi:hypothetical protein